MSDGVRGWVEASFRHEVGRVVGALTRALGDFDVAEEAVQDALVEAVARWPVEGVPERPAAWLQTTARNRAIDRLRREARGREKLAIIAADPLREVPQAEPDERLRLLFLCCHPALSVDAQITLTLRAVAGLTTHEIASAFLTTEATVSQRITRAKRKVAAARIPYCLPDDDRLAERLPAVLAVLYLMFNEGYLSSHSDVPERRWLEEEAEELTGLLTRLMPREPEPLGLLALMRMHLARSRARFDADGNIVRLRDQDRESWDTVAIADAIRVLRRAAGMHKPGPYQIQAAVLAVHAEAPRWEATDWPQIVTLYDLLLRHEDTPVIRLNRLIAVAFTDGPQAALQQAEPLRDVLARYHLFHATRAELLRELGRITEAADADRRALELVSSPAERALITSRLAGVS
ncbi:MAG TPA: sigma-70 family RNA polymerase sigma factor [Streptosporangiaceae bacterium]|nr:sigma-70 family RNA polymerase sigma factor [Streptosporangiaceae bacterium]